MNPTNDQHQGSPNPVSHSIELSLLRTPYCDSTRLPEILQPGEVYRLVPTEFLGYNHVPDYDEGWFIHVKIIGAPDEFGSYPCTTFGEDGKHLGPGGGWTKAHEDQGLSFRRDQLEYVP